MQHQDRRSGPEGESAAKSGKRIGLVLGAGGPVGHAFHAGVLHALHDGTGWDAGDAELVVGTSAGAQVGALLRAGLKGADLAARAAGKPLCERAHAIAQHYIRPYPKDGSKPKTSRKPASLGFIMEALKNPGHFRPGRLVSALLPEGHVCLGAQAEGFRRIFGAAWPTKRLWITAVHLDTGERVAFGKEGAPVIDVGTAVTCSGAVPGVCRTVHHDGRRYVDGGIASATHLDLLHKADLDMVIVSSPLSMFAPMRALLWNEIRKLKRHVPVVTFEPKGEALDAMGLNPMDISRAPRVAKVAYECAMRDIQIRGPNVWASLTS
ncbi:MAG: patatin-like phospholipase family protein [Polyangiaceae bacterium]|nr:patatin-like phospholipase family protein [Polyangiaceae bacterium]